MATEFKVSEEREEFEVNGLPGIRTHFPDGGVEEKVELADGRIQTYYFKPNYIMYNRIDYPDGSWTMHEYPYGSNIEMITENDGNGNETTTTLSSIDKRVLNKETTYNPVISSTSGTDTPAAASATAPAPGTNPTTTSASATGTNSQSTKNTITLPNGQQIITETTVEETSEGKEITWRKITETNADGTPRKVTIEKTGAGNYKRTEIIQPDKTSTVIIENGDNVTTLQKDSAGNIIDKKTEFPTTVNGKATGGKTTINEKTNWDGSNSIEKTNENGYSGTIYDENGIITKVEYSCDGPAGGQQANRDHDLARQNLKESREALDRILGPKSHIDILKDYWITEGGSERVNALNNSCENAEAGISQLSTISQAIEGVTLKLEPKDDRDNCNCGA